MKKSWQAPSIYTLCAVDEESINHFFLGDPFSTRVWDRVGAMPEITSPSTISICEPSLVFLKIHIFYKMQKGALGFISGGCFLGDLKGKNNRIFNNSA